MAAGVRGGVGSAFHEDLRDVLEAEGETPAAGQTFEVHEAGHVDGGDDFGAGLLMVGEAVESHHAGDGFLGDGEGSAEAAALVGAGEVDEVDAVQVFEELTGFVELGADPF